MTIAITILHVLVSLFMIAVVLLQSGKGAEMGASFGAGGSQSVFGAGGGTTFLSKATTGAAIIFMLTSLSLAYLSGQPNSSSIMSSKAKPAAVAKEAVKPTASTTAPTGAAPVSPVTAPAAKK